MTDLLRMPSSEGFVSPKEAIVGDDYDDIRTQLTDAIATAIANGYRPDRLLLPKEVYQGRKISQYLSCALRSERITPAQYQVLIVIFNAGVEDLKRSRQLERPIGAAATQAAEHSAPTPHLDGEDTQPFDFAQRAAGEATRSPWA